MSTQTVIGEAATVLQVLDKIELAARRAAIDQNDLMTRFAEELLKVRMTTFAAAPKAVD